MNRETWKAMTDDERRSIVAELAGWSRKAFTPKECYWWHDEKDKSRPPADDGIRFEPPDFLNDLNAMHDLEVRHIFGKVASEETQKKMWDGYTLVEQYIWLLENVCGSHSGIVFATAAQRAEAFAITMVTKEYPG